MSAAEFAEWQIEYEQDPWGAWRGDLRSAMLASTIANRHRGRHERPYTTQDFMPQFGDTSFARQPLIARRQTTQEIQALFGQWIEA